MDGFEWILRIREAGSPVPVIMYSTTMNQSRINRSYQSGANLFLPKPDNFNALIQSIEQILGFNWVKPEEITQRFFQKGIYFPFISQKEDKLPSLIHESRLPKAC
jgi:DNA-binding NarL/FixJ family response regulator